MIEFLKTNRTVILILTMFASIMWLISLYTIPKEAAPSLDIPNYIMSVVYPWADPSTIEQQVIRKFENKLKSVSYVKKITSSSANSFGIISIEFLEQKEDVDAVNDIKSAIDQVYPTLPEDVKYPTFKKVDIADSPIYMFAVASNQPTETMYDTVKKLEDNIKWIQWVSDVIVIWKPTKQININIDYSKLTSYNLNVVNIIWALQSALFKFPADKKTVNWALYTFEIWNYNEDILDIVEKYLNIDLVNNDGKAVKLRDIGSVKSTFAYSKNKSFLLTDDWAVNTLSMQVKKVPWEDIERITNEVMATIDEFKKSNPGYTTVETYSMKESTDKMYWTFIESFLETAVLVFVVILLVFWFRSSIVILISFLISYWITFWILKWIGYTFNNIVSFSLILVLWVMVDNLIVIAQWIIAWYKSWLKNVWESISYSIKNYWTAVTYGTFTTIAAFAPLYVMLSGIIWEYMKPFPVTVILNLLLSIVIAIIALPVIFSYFIKAENTDFKSSKISDWLDHFWERLWAFFAKVNKTKLRSLWVVISFWIVFIFWIFLIWSWFIKSDFLPPSDSDNLWINMKYKAWIDLEMNQQYTTEMVDKIGSFLKQTYPKEIKSISIDLWSERSWDAAWWALAGWTSNYSISSMTIRLIPWKERDIKSYIMKDKIQDFLMSEVKWKYSYLEDIYALTESWGPSAWKAIWFNIMWDDVDKIWKYVAQILPEIEKINGVYNVATSLEYSNWKVKYIIDDDKAKQLWINSNSAVYSILWLKNSNYEPNWIKVEGLNEFGDDEIEVKAFFLYTWDIESLQIWSNYLSQIVSKVQLKPDLKALDKIDGKLSITVDADKRNEVALSAVTAEIEKVIKNNPLPEWLSYKPAWDIEDQAKSMQDLWLALLTGIALMYLILIVLFKNLKYPTVIMSSIILCVAWVFIILAITGLTFSFPAQLGIFWVFWVWVNQAIIHLIDFKEFHENDWMTTIDAFTKSIAKRFEPIFLTKFVTIIWLLILAFKDEVFGGMAVAFIGWLLMSFLITLLYMPSLVRLISKN